MGKSPNSLVTSGDGVFQFEATFTSYQQMEFDLPKGAGNSEGEDTLRVMLRFPAFPRFLKSTQLFIGGGWTRAWVPRLLTVLEKVTEL